MKKLILFIIIIFVSFILIWLNTTFISTETKIFDYLSEKYPDTIVQGYIEGQKKWWWISYAITPLLIGLKVLLVAFCLNFIKLFDLPGLEKVKFSDFLFIALIAEVHGCFFKTD